MDRESLIDKYPTLFHMAEDGSWPGIQERGLLSTQALVDLYQPAEARREAVLGQQRRTTYTLSRSGMPDAVVRDQLPLKLIDKKLTPGTSLQNFLDALNRRVFLWTTEERLAKLLNARPYRARPHIVLRVRTRDLVAAYGDQIELCRMNSGAVTHDNHPVRGPEIFESIEAYQTRRHVGTRVSSTPPVELTVPYAVPDVVRYVESAQRWVPGAAEPEPVFAATS